MYARYITGTSKRNVFAVADLFKFWEINDKINDNISFTVIITMC